MSLEKIPGFLPILNFMSRPLPAFLTSLSLATVPFLVIKLSVMMAHLDFLRMVNRTSFSSYKMPPVIEAYDFIVVGGGSGGAAVATRLSKKFNVLLLEAGGDPHPLTYIPFMTEPLLNQPMIDWQYKTESLNNSGYVWIDQKMSWPRGRSLGGSSNSNHMVYMRGNPEDFNRWASHTGDPRWRYENVENIFKGIEDYHGHWKSSYHGVGGPMHIEKARFTPSAEYWLEAGTEVGKRVSDPNGYQSEGFFPLDVTQKRGVRFSTYRGYIEPNLKNENLTIHRYSFVTKVHFDDNLRAIGVTYYRHAIKQYVKANKEIIISCGAINSPKLLMLSGIGPKKHLHSVGIQTLVDLQVGENLQDHVLAPIGPFLLNQSVSFLRTRDLTPLSALDYVSSGNGPFSTSDGLSATALISSSKASKSWPDILAMHIGIGIYQDMGKELERMFGLKAGATHSFLNYNANNDSNFVFLAIGRPKSRGFIRLRNNNPFSKPVIAPNYFSDKHGEDVQIMLEGINFFMNLYENTTTYQKLGAKLAPNPFPGCEHHIIKSKAYWECYMKTNIHTMFHPSGTCSMGHPTDSTAVVDSELRVIGTKGLRVADASTMPFVTNANLNGPSIMIGEMCAELVKNSWS